MLTRAQKREAHVRQLQLLRIRFSGHVDASQIGRVDDLIAEGEAALGPTACRCMVCGNYMEPEFLRPSNGDRACGPCLHVMQDEFEAVCGVYAEEDVYALSAQ